MAIAASLRLKHLLSHPTFTPTAPYGVIAHPLIAYIRICTAARTTGRAADPNLYFPGAAAGVVARAFVVALIGSPQRGFIGFAARKRALLCCLRESRHKHEC